MGNMTFQSTSFPDARWREMIKVAWASHQCVLPLQRANHCDEKKGSWRLSLSGQTDPLSCRARWDEQLLQLIWLERQLFLPVTTWILVGLGWDPTQSIPTVLAPTSLHVGLKWVVGSIALRGTEGGDGIITDRAEWPGVAEENWLVTAVHSARAVARLDWLSVTIFLQELLQRRVFLLCEQARCHESLSVRHEWWGLSMASLRWHAGFPVNIWHLWCPPLHWPTESLVQDGAFLVGIIHRVLSIDLGRFP